MVSPHTTTDGSVRGALHAVTDHTNHTNVNGRTGWLRWTEAGANHLSNQNPRLINVPIARKQCSVCFNLPLQLVVRPAGLQLTQEKRNGATKYLWTRREDVDGKVGRIRESESLKRIQVVETRILPTKLQMVSPGLFSPEPNVGNLPAVGHLAFVPHRVLVDMFYRMDRQIAHLRQRSPLRSPLHQRDRSTPRPWENMISAKG